MTIEYTKLPIEADSLEPFISKRTMEIHYEKHYKKYLDNTNRLISGTHYESLSAEEILLRSHNTDSEIYNNAAQVWNHEFFWKCLRANCKPSSRLNLALQKDFGGMDEFQEKFNEAAAKLFGSGWTWLTRDGNNNLVIRAMSNAENPMVHGEVPILACDVWEHAYYLDYQNQRVKYLKSFWSVVNWDFVAGNLSRDLPPYARELRPRNELTTAEDFNKAQAAHH
jgi:Fe-Mn family superoxide dismutase